MWRWDRGNLTSGGGGLAASRHSQPPVVRQQKAKAVPHAIGSGMLGFTSNIEPNAVMRIFAMFASAGMLAKMNTAPTLTARARRMAAGPFGFG